MRWVPRDRLRVGFASRGSCKNGLASGRGWIRECGSLHPCRSCGSCKPCIFGASRQHILRDVQSWVPPFFRQVRRDASLDNSESFGCPRGYLSPSRFDFDPFLCRSPDGFAGEPSRRGMDRQTGKPISHRAIGRRIEPCQSDFVVDAQAFRSNRKLNRARGLSDPHRSWEFQDEFRATADFALDADPTAVGFEDLARGGQA